MTKEQIIEAELKTWGKNLFIELRKTLRDKKVEHAGQDIALLFEDNMNVSLNIDGNEYSWIVSMKKYWKFLEYGTKGGGWVPKKKMEDWITLKGMNPSSILHQMKLASLSKQGKTPTGRIQPLKYNKALPQLAYVLQKSIYKKGISEWQKKNFGKKSTNFIRETLNEQVDLLAKSLEKKLAKPITLLVKEELEK